MKKKILSLLLSSLATLVVTQVRADFTYSNAVVTLNPVAYWPLDETNAPPSLFIATNSGTLGTQANGYYNNPYYPDGTGFDLFNYFFTGDVSGATSDGDTAVQFNGGANANDNSGYILIPDINHDLDQSNVSFTAEAWVMPEGGDPNDPNGTSYASTEWTSIIKKGGGGTYYTENGDSNGNTYGWTVAMAGKYVLGYPVGWYGGVPYTGPIQLQTNACWVVDFYNGGNGNVPSLEFDVPLNEPTPQWFHLVLTYDGTNANFYVNGALAATTVPGLPQSTNQVFAAGAFPASATGAYQFTTTATGVGYVPDTLNPMCLGNINESYSIINEGYPQANAIGFNCQGFNGVMDEVAVYTNALSAGTVLKHYTDATASDTTLYTNDVLGAYPYVYLRFDEPASTFTLPPSDYSTYPIANCYGSAPVNGLYQPGVTPGAPGAPGNGFGSTSYAVQLNGLDAGVDVGDGILFGTTLDPQGTQPFSVAYWFRANPADCYGRFQTILGRGDSGWRSSIDGSGHLRWNPGAGPELSSPGNYNDGAWHQVVGVSDGTNATLYVDGQAVTSSGGVGYLNGASLDLLIGGAPDYTTSDKNYSSQRYFAGAISQLAFFESALTADQVQTLYSAAELAPVISQNPQSITIGLGSSGSLNVIAPLATGYQWYQGTTALSDVAGNISGATTSTLIITNATSDNGGNYFVVVTNSFGSVTSAVATVTVGAAPTVLTQPSPTNTMMYAGNQIDFSVAAAGANPLSYQWFKNASAIGGATASNLVVTVVTGTNTYDCVVTNSYGAITSSVVTVVGQTFIAPASGFTINFAVAPGSTASQVYSGQGAYSDSGNNFWNPFPANSGASTGYVSTSAGSQTLVAASLIYGFNNGAGGETQGTPGYLLAYEDAVNAGNPGIGTADAPEGQIKINDLPQGSYTLYLYGNNYDCTRGSTFAIASANGGTADGGTNSTVNGSVVGSGAIANGTCSFAEGDNYVIFHDVTTDPSGTITITYIPNDNSISGLSGEAPFNGMQVVGAPPTAQPVLTIQQSAGSAVISWSPATGTLQTTTNLTGTWTDVTGATSPYTNSITGTQQFFRVKQ